jgi:hypothetical protein
LIAKVLKTKQQNLVSKICFILKLIYLFIFQIYFKKITFLLLGLTATLGPSAGKMLFCHLCSHVLGRTGLESSSAHRRQLKPWE